VMFSGIHFFRPLPILPSDELISAAVSFKGFRMRDSHSIDPPMHNPKATSEIILFVLHRRPFQKSVQFERFLILTVFSPFQMSDQPQRNFILGPRPFAYGLSSRNPNQRRVAGCLIKLFRKILRPPLESRKSFIRPLAISPGVDFLPAAYEGTSA